ncbi:MAG: hypothetical protein HC851_08290 [Acaryochloris sp. RU_4_1]|nr:hypothetical protein [Acaryochloris sp. SU_5_25]NJM65657.1 hypothetical protein [Acaryochloris sp. RU_4_1]NJN37747.1 hypothetical protein [Acaryochloridaceae cyanobacterium CSU_3_4]NJR54574.1 hypothetical protein [Acaryochloris sp. CRU_2_0]
MDSPQADDPPERSADVLSRIAGAAIAILTLAMPLYVTAYYSSIPKIPLSSQISQPSVTTNNPRS